MIKVPATRIGRLRHDIRRTLGRSTVTARVLARITGQGIAMTKAIVPGNSGKLLLRNAYRLLGRRSSWDPPHILDGPMRAHYHVL